MTISVITMNTNSSPIDFHALLKEAYRLANNQSFAQALAICDHLNRVGQTTAGSLFIEGYSSYKMGQRQDGINKIEHAILQQKTYEWIQVLGEFYQECGIPEMYSAYKLALEVKPDGLPDSFNRVYLDALLRTKSTPFPLARRKRFAMLANHFEATLKRTDSTALIAECGCFQGLSTRMLATIAAHHQPGFDGTGMVVCDSFEGLGEIKPEDHIPDDHPDAARLRTMTRVGHFAAAQSQVMENLSDFPNIRWVKGWIPESLSNLPEDARYRFVNVDVDMYEPTSGAFCYFWPKIVSGGMIVSDDYHWPGAHKAINDLVASLPEASYHFHTNDDGQAWLEKP